MTGEYHRSGPFGKLAANSSSNPVEERPDVDEKPSDAQLPGWWADVPQVAPEDSAPRFADSETESTEKSHSFPITETSAEQTGMIESVTEPAPENFPVSTPNLGIPEIDAPVAAVVNPFQREYRAVEPEAHDLLPSWKPPKPQSLKDAGLTEHELQELILKFLLSQNVATGRQVSRQIRLCYSITERQLQQLRHEQLIVYRKSSGNDFEYQLTSAGIDQATRYYRQSSYHGSAPVPLEDYIQSVRSQSLTHRKPGIHDLKRAFRELFLGEDLLSQLGQALHSGRGLFLFGPPGNGKTSLAQRMTDVFGDSIWIPRSINAYGEIIRLYDPNKHQELPEPTTNQDELDQRWVRIARPTVVVGGELRMENLEITRCHHTGISEAPLQMKSNCGTLVIDDFGRQRMSTSDLLNRWIVPLEDRFDLLNLTSGRTIRIPFDQLIVFSTNLEPRDLVEEAFLRRIPYKIEVHNPTEKQYHALFLKTARSMGFECSGDVVDYLIEHHYRTKKREFRFCHVRDLLRQVQNFCTFHEEPFIVTKKNLDMAVVNYFSVI